MNHKIKAFQVKTSAKPAEKQLKKREIQAVTEVLQRNCGVK